MNIFVLIFSLLLLTHEAFCNEYQTTDVVYKVTARPSEDQVTKNKIDSKIEICSKNKEKIDCVVYPTGVDHLFKGTSEDWSYFFRRCKSFNHVSNLADITIALQILIVMPFVVAPVASASLGTRIGVTTGAEVGVMSLGSRVYP